MMVVKDYTSLSYLTGRVKFVIIIKDRTFAHVPNENNYPSLVTTDAHYIYK